MAGSIGAYATPKKDRPMKTTTSAKIAALAFGLGLAATTVFAADYGQGHDRNDQQPAATQQDQNDQSDKDRDRDHRDGNKGDRTPKSHMNKTDYQNNNSGDNGNNDRNRHRANDDNRNNNDNNWQNNNRTNGNDWNRNHRRGFDVTQYRRNFKSPQRFRIGIYHAPRGYYYRRWHYGERLPISFWARDYWLLDYIAFGLFAPPPGFIWVRYGPDALLINEETGEIIQVRYDVFYS
jgi:Ni/Co efflux regulator RcnB